MKMSEQLDRIEERLDRIDKKFDELVAGPDGLIVQVALLKQSDGRRSWWVKSIVGAWIVTIVGFLAHKLGLIDVQ
jgi:hypothetical protein